jgi:hypothetical protein
MTNQMVVKRRHFLSQYGTERFVGFSLIPMQWQDVTKGNLLGTFLASIMGFVHSR